MGYLAHLQQPTVRKKTQDRCSAIDAESSTLDPFYLGLCLGVTADCLDWSGHDSNTKGRDRR